MRLSLVVVSAALCASSLAAHADTFNWMFASANVSGSGTLVATPYQYPGEYEILSGSGTVTDTTYGTMSVQIAPCADPNATCTLVNTDHAGTNLTYDNLLFPGNSPGFELDSDGIVLTPGFDNTTAIGIYDSPSQEFYEYSPNGYQNLTTPFTVTPAAAMTVTPEPSSIALLGTGLLGVAGMLRRRLR